MKVSEVNGHVRDAATAIGYGFYFGSKDYYNTKRTPNDKEIILEPYPMKTERSEASFYDTTFRLWVGQRRMIGEQFRNETGANETFIQTLADDVGLLLDQFEANEKVLVKQKRHEIVLRYYEADSGQTVNSQAFMFIEIPVRLWKT